MSLVLPLYISEITSLETKLHAQGFNTHPATADISFGRNDGLFHCPEYHTSWRTRQRHKAESPRIPGSISWEVGQGSEGAPQEYYTVPAALVSSAGFVRVQNLICLSTVTLLSTQEIYCLSGHVQSSPESSDFWHNRSTFVSWVSFEKEGVGGERGGEKDREK